MIDLNHHDHISARRRRPQSWHAAIVSIAVGLLIGVALVALGVCGSVKL
jgi:hypothetical protein